MYNVAYIWTAFVCVGRHWCAKISSLRSILRTRKVLLCYTFGTAINAAVGARETRREYIIVICIFEDDKIGFSSVIKSVVGELYGSCSIITEELAKNNEMQTKVGLTANSGRCTQTSNIVEKNVEDKKIKKNKN